MIQRWEMLRSRKDTRTGPTAASSQPQQRHTRSLVRLALRPPGWVRVSRALRKVPRCTDVPAKTTHSGRGSARSSPAMTTRRWHASGTQT
jgi:hypothetical protein